ncbi:MAG: GldG family protein [Akkermansia sp.]
MSSNPNARKAKSNPIAWINLFLLAIIVITLNFIAGREYMRRDLTEDHRFTISERTINVLSSERIQKHETPIRVIFAFQRSTQNYARMYSLLEEYKRYGKEKIEVECIDPLRQPNRAREISQIYGIDFNQNLCVVDARSNPNVALKTFEEERSERQHVRVRPGASFIKYQTLPDESKRAVALMMDDVLCSAITEAVEGELRRMYVVEGKGGVSRDNSELLDLLGEITSSLNIELAWLNTADIDSIPADAKGLFIVSPQTDFTESEMYVINEFWQREGRHSVLVALDSQQTNLPRLYRFLRENGIRPNMDRVLLRDRTRAYYDISAVFPKGLNCTRSFWNNTTNIEGQSMSLSLEFGDENAASLRKLHAYPLLMSTDKYYGETRTGLTPSFTAEEDFAGPLTLGAAITQGDTKDPNNISTMLVLGSTHMLTTKNARTEQRDYLRTLFAWMSNRPEYAGKSANEDLTMKIDLNRHSQNMLEYLTLIFMPFSALLMAFIIWNTRRH